MALRLRRCVSHTSCILLAAKEDARTGSAEYLNCFRLAPLSTETLAYAMYFIDLAWRKCISFPARSPRCPEDNDIERGCHYPPPTNLPSRLPSSLKSTIHEAAVTV
jgi:hypothetical protein